MPSSSRISPQMIAVVRVFVSAGNLHHPLGHQLLHRVLNITLIPRVHNVFYYPPDYPGAPFGLAQNQKSRVRRHRSSVEIHDHFLPGH